ncbi:MAG: PcfJ domain-containing protein [Leucothrix sp.]
MNTAAAKQTIKECFQTLTDEQLQQYHLTHDYFTGRPLATPQVPRDDSTVDASTQQNQRNLSRLNEVLYPTPTLGCLLGDSLAALTFGSKTTGPKPTARLEKPSEDLVNRAKQWFDQYQDDGLESLLPAQSAQLSDANLAVIKQAFSRNTVLIQNVCMLSPFWIRSPLDWDTSGKNDLLTHLFIEYDAPAFLKACWSTVSDEANARWLLCFILYAQGGSLKALAKHFGWTTVSNKLWHQLFSCPTDMKPLDAVLYAEYKRLGGWDQDFACLMTNEAYVIDLLDPVSEAGRDFWYDTCRWTIHYQCELPTEQMTKLLWWARHQLTEFARHGETYRLQGRSLAKVLDSIAEYDREQLQIQQARDRMAERARLVSMARIEERERLRQEHLEDLAARQALRAYENQGYIDYDTIDISWRSRGWSWSTTAHGKKWRFVELNDSQSLRDEGAAMEHCVASYAMSCVDGYSVIVSVICEGRRQATIEIEPKSRQLIQMQGKMNAEPSKSVQSVAKAWLQRVVKR